MTGTLLDGFGRFFVGSAPGSVKTVRNVEPTLEPVQQFCVGPQGLKFTFGDSRTSISGPNGALKGRTHTLLHLSRGMPYESFDCISFSI